MALCDRLVTTLTRLLTVYYCSHTTLPIASLPFLLALFFLHEKVFRANHAEMVEARIASDRFSLQSSTMAVAANRFRGEDRAEQPKERDGLPIDGTSSGDHVTYTKMS